MARELFRLFKYVEHDKLEDDRKAKDAISAIYEVMHKRVVHADNSMLMKCINDKRAGLRCEVESIGSFHAKHLEQTLLDARVIVLQSEVEHLARMDVVLPEGCARGDVIAELRHEERLANLRRADEQIGSRVEQVLNHD